MRLARHFAAVFMAQTALAGVVLVLLLAGITLMERAGTLHGAAGVDVALRLACVTAGRLAFLLAPLVALIGLLAAGTVLGRRGELLAVAALGGGLTRLWGPFVAAALAMAAATATFGAWALPEINARTFALDAELLGAPDRTMLLFARRAEWYRAGPHLLYLPTVVAPPGCFARPSVYEMRDGQLGSVTHARLLCHGTDGWTLRDAQRYAVDGPQSAAADVLPLALDVAPAALRDVVGHPETLALAPLSGLIARRRAAGLAVAAHQVAWHARLAVPAAVVALVLLAAPWALAVAARRRLSQVFGTGVAAAAAWLAVSQLARLLALSGAVPAPLGAWGPPGLALGLLPLSVWLARRAV